MADGTRCWTPPWPTTPSCSSGWAGQHKPPDFDRLARAGLTPGAPREAIDALFAATFRLAHWLFVAQDHPSGARPYVKRDAGLEDGAPMVKTFTDIGRLQDYVRENKLGAGVTHIHFNGNRASDDYYLPLVQMPIVHRHLQRLELLPGADG